MQDSARSTPTAVKRVAWKVLGGASMTVARPRSLALLGGLETNHRYKLDWPIRECIRPQGEDRGRRPHIAESQRITHPPTHTP